MENKNIKRGLFNKEELTLYKSFVEKDVDTILEYQDKLPILSEDDDKWINTRQLHNELGVGRDYSTWIKQQIEDLFFEEDQDYKIKWIKNSVPFEGDKKTSLEMVRLGYSINYFTTISNAKEIAMVAGAKGGRTSKELIHNSKLARKYFILIEKAFKERTTWNGDRLKTIGMFHELNDALDKHRAILEKNIPVFWGDIPLEKFEYSKLNQIILGKSATDYRAEKHIKDTTPIRNTFNDNQLDTVHKLEQYDAILIDVQNMYEYSDREPLLVKYYNKIA